MKHILKHKLDSVWTTIYTGSIVNGKTPEQAKELADMAKDALLKDMQLSGLYRHIKLSVTEILKCYPSHLCQENVVRSTQVVIYTDLLGETKPMSTLDAVEYVTSLATQNNEAIPDDLKINISDRDGFFQYNLISLKNLEEEDVKVRNTPSPYTNFFVARLNTADRIYFRTTCLTLFKNVQKNLNGGSNKLQPDELSSSI